MIALLAGLAAVAAEIDVRITDLRSDDGQVLVYVFCTPAGFPVDTERACERRAVPISAGQGQTTFTLPSGFYAVVAIHDEDGDGELDTNFLGIPREGLGSSNNPRGGFGPPRFEDARFTLKEAHTAEIEVVYL